MSGANWAGAGHGAGNDVAAFVRARAAFFARSRGAAVVLAVHALRVPELMAHVWPSMGAHVLSAASSAGGVDVTPSLVAPLLALCGNALTVAALLRVPLHAALDGNATRAQGADEADDEAWGGDGDGDADVVALRAWQRLMRAAAPDGWWASRHALALKCLPAASSSSASPSSSPVSASTGARALATGKISVFPRVAKSTTTTTTTTTGYV